MDPGMPESALRNVKVNQRESSLREMENK